MDILHIYNWRFFTPPPWILKGGPYPSLNQLNQCPNTVRLLPGAKLSVQAAKFVPTI
jgi:hypothetical protein